ncbi:unnamed protein product [Parnassius mnemosyne]|uniref:THAP-type domain-containing protein n=1 Tax=Parnassius mnemosyne TaxID=213953 RepID=A0AAV1KHB6_9NEOP
MHLTPDNDELRHVTTLSPYGQKVVEYIAGFVVHNLLKSLKCETCTSALLPQIDTNEGSLIVHKDKGKLIHPSSDTIAICQHCELELRKGVQNKRLKKDYTTDFFLPKVTETLLQLPFFPINPEVKDKWILATGKKIWFPSKHSKICSAHFQEKDFNPTRKRRILLDHAYPTIHVWTTSENVSDNQVNVTPSKSPSPSMSSKSAKRAIQLDPDIMENPRKRKMQRIINEKENVIKTQRSKIKRLQGQ